MEQYKIFFNLKYTFNGLSFFKVVVSLKFFAMFIFRSDTPEKD